MDSSSGDLYSKTTTTGNTGWSQVGGGGSYHYESFSFDNSTSSSDVWVPFGSHIIEQVQTTAPRAYHLWAVPFDGEVSTIRISSETDPGTTTMQFYQADGSTTIGVAGTGSPSAISGTSTLYETNYTFATPVSVTAGQRIALGINITTACGEVAGHIELEA
jgi:hypothetical protein